MKNLVLFAFILTASISFSQNVGINGTGASPDASAILDVSATDAGVLVPRVDIVDLSTAAPVATPAISLLVYNTNTTTGPGYFYWDGTAWVTIGGVKEINDLTDGKTDYGGEESVYLGKNAGAAATAGGFWDGKFNVAIGVDAFKTTKGGHESVAIGYKALELGAFSTRNTAVGYLALQTNSNQGNTAIGSQSMSVSTGYKNSALGNFSLGDLTTGNENVALGFRSGSGLVTGSRNLFVGYQAAVFQTAGDNNIAIGSDANLVNFSGSNQMNIGNIIYGTNISTATGKIGIGDGNNAPNSTLDVGGSVSYNIVKTTSTSFTLDATHHTVVFDVIGLNATVNLPPANTCTGRVYVIRTLRFATGENVTITPAGSETIFYHSSLTQVVIGLVAGSIERHAVTIQSDGTGWIVISDVVN